MAIAQARRGGHELSSFIRRAFIIRRRNRFSSAKRCVAKRVLKSLEGVEFMDAYHSLNRWRRATGGARDRREMKSGAEQCGSTSRTNRPRFIIERFPNIYQTCLRYA